MNLSKIKKKLCSVALAGIGVSVLGCKDISLANTSEANSGDDYYVSMETTLPVAKSRVKMGYLMTVLNRFLLDCDFSEEYLNNLKATSEKNLTDLGIIVQEIISIAKDFSYRGLTRTHHILVNIGVQDVDDAKRIFIAAKQLDGLQLEVMSLLLINEHNKMSPDDVVKVIDAVKDIDSERLCPLCRLISDCKIHNADDMIPIFNAAKELDVVKMTLLTKITEYCSEYSVDNIVSIINLAKELDDVQICRIYGVFKNCHILYPGDVVHVLELFKDITGNRLAVMCRILEGCYVNRELSWDLGLVDSSNISKFVDVTKGLSDVQLSELLSEVENNNRIGITMIGDLVKSRSN